MRIEHIVPVADVKKGSYQIYIEVACNGMFGVGMHNLRYQPPDVSLTPRLLRETGSSDLSSNSWNEHSPS